MDEVLVKEQENSSEEEIIKTKEIIMDLDAYQREQEELEKMNKVSVRKLGYLFVKRVFDIMCGLIGVVVLIPVGIILKIITMATGDFHPIVFTQNRIGKNGKEFKFYKFRSMVPNADEILQQTLKTDKVRAEEWKKYQKFENDPRITKIGNILRKTSLDEVPQFINILKGDMSMIGPRPLIPGELDSHDGNHEIYESVRPGITGWWACNGRSATTYEERLELEYYYVKNRSLWLDIKCVFKTISAVICKKGAK